MGRVAKVLTVAVLVSLVSAPMPGWAQGPKPPSSLQSPGQAAVVIVSPREGDTVPAHQPLPTVFTARSGPEGDHVHLVLDGVLVRMLPIRGAYNASGAAEIRYVITDGLYPGRHTITVSVVDAAHAPIGVEASVTVIAKAGR
jgi:hypothetical protein